MDPHMPRARALLVRDGRIAAVGSESEVRSAAGTTFDDVDCDGAIVAPAFIDPHVHLFAYAASLSAVDCSPDAAQSIAEIVTAIRSRALQAPPGEWIRATGYRETELAE